MRKSNSYNVFEIILSALSWVALAVMIGVLIGGYWVSNDSFAIPGYILLKYWPSHPAMIISLLAIGLMFAANLFNNIIKFVDTDRHNLLFQAIVLVYGVIYLILLFVITFDESIAWYPMSFFISYMIGGICDILFARFYYNSGEGWQRSPRGRHHFGFSFRLPHRKKKARNESDDERTNEKSESIQQPQIESGALEFVRFIDSVEGTEIMQDVIKDAIHDDSGVYFDDGISYEVVPTEPRLNKKRRYRFAKYMLVKVAFHDDLWDKFLQYADMINGGDIFMESTDLLYGNGMSARNLTKDTKIGTKSIAEAISRDAERYVGALQRFESVVSRALADRLAEYSLYTPPYRVNYLASCANSPYYEDTFFMQLKKVQKKVFDISNDWRITLDTRELYVCVEQLLKNSFNVFVRKEVNREKEMNLDRFILLDSERCLSRLETHIKKYLGEKIKEVERSCEMFADKVKVTITPGKLVNEGGREQYEDIKMKVYFKRVSNAVWGDWCAAFAVTNIGEDSEKLANDFLNKKIAEAFDDFVINHIPRQDYKLGLRPSDTSLEYWIENDDPNSAFMGENSGERPIELKNGFKYEYQYINGDAVKDDGAN